MRSRGFTLAEVVVASAVAGLLLVASLTVLGGSATGQAKTADLERGCLLARDLLAEICAKPYEDSVSPVLGLESGETTTNRLGFDDVDDYAGLVESPPVERDGSAITGVTGWTRKAFVTYATGSIEEGGATDLGAKYVVVAVYRGHAEVARLAALRTRGRDNLSE